MKSPSVLICSVPGTFSDQPALAPAVLKACVKAAGYQVNAVDLNIKIYNQIKQSPHSKKLKDFFFDQLIDADTKQEIGNFIDYSSDLILSYQPDIVVLSLLTQDCQFFSIWLCYHLKTLRPDLRIVIGGSGIKNYISESSIDFGQFMKDKGFIDDYINGDGEYSLIEYIKGNMSFSGINAADWTPIQDLNTLPHPDFDDYDFSEYRTPGIPICDSRGCVRQCEFCDVIVHWKKYQYRTADNIFKEMLCQIEKYHVRYFYFYNALTNGNMKEFQKLLDLMCQYNMTNPDQQLAWTGYFIVRSKKQHPPDLWQKIKQSNGFLQLGIESVIQKVRMDLGKNFSNEDIDYHLEMAHRYQVPVMLLMIVGYPTETKTDFEFTKQWFKDRKKYAFRPIQSVVLSLAAILPNTALDHNQEKHGFVKGHLPTIWLSPVTSVTTQDRLLYHKELSDLISRLGFGQLNDNNSVTVANRERAA